MDANRREGALPALPRMATGVPGLDDILGGGLPTDRLCLIAGPPGTGKTTLSSQIAFAAASAGARVVVATLLVETHDVMLANLRSFRFFNPALVAERVHYVNLLGAMRENGLDGIVAAARRSVRELGASLLIVDGTAIVEDVTMSQLDLRRFAQQLQVQAVLLGCTTLLLTGQGPDDARPLGAQADGVVMLAHDRIAMRRVRTLEVLKLRGASHVGGAHEFAIGEEGVEFYPRLEAVSGWRRPPEQPEGGLSTGVDGLDAMLGGGLMPLSSTLVIGTPGAGKTLLGLSFVAEGARRGEHGLVAGFHETEADLVRTAAGIGLDLESHIDADRVRLLWSPPLELSADAWARRLLATVAEHRSRRVFIDAITDVQRLLHPAERSPTFVAALINELRALGATALIATELDSYTDDHLTIPVPAASAAMDNGILLRHVELRSSLLRLVSVLKARRAPTDPAIREFTISDAGIVVSGPFAARAGLLTGRASPTDANE